MNNKASIILEALKKKGFTKYKTHKETNISQATLGNWEKGKTNPDPDKLEKLKKYYEKVINN